MARIERFEDIRAWQQARVLAQMVYEISGQGAFARDFGLRNQIRDAAGSVMHNIAEGFDAGSDQEFVRFLRYARRSTTEVQSELYIALDQAYISHERFQEIYDQATNVKKLINAFSGYLRSPGDHKLREVPAEYVVNPSDRTDLLDDHPTKRPNDHPTKRPNDHPTKRPNDHPTK